MDASFDRIVLKAGALLFAEGETGAFAYLVKSGRIEIFILRDGRELSLAMRGPGEIFGEMALIDRGRRSAAARVAEDCELLLISEAQIAHRIADTDPILRMCLGVVIDRYRETVARLDRSHSRPFAEAKSASTSEHVTAAIRTLSLDHDLRRAVRDQELEIFFQPIVRFPGRRLAGFEALLRWHHPERGLVSPGEFIPVAEASGFIVEITAFCLTEVCRILPRMMSAALSNAAAVDPLFLSVNVSGHDLGHAAFLASTSDVLGASGISPSTIHLEVTESVLMKDPQKAASVLAACRALGLKISIDDFGTGYSSLSHLSTLPITTIKVDRSFIGSMTVDPTSRKIIHMILRLANELGIPVVAEGIEHETQASLLEEQGCALGQGFLFGRPMPLERSLTLIRTWVARDTAAADIPVGPGLAGANR
jgi:EAL domain-containing protein (putative c-di-GMP-specific phosphodiesterase class I)